MNNLKFSKINFTCDLTRVLKPNILCIDAARSFARKEKGPTTQSGSI